MDPLGSGQLSLHGDGQSSRAILDSARDYAVIAADLTSCIVEWSTGAEVLFGWTAAEAIGRPLAFIYRADDRAAHVPEREFGQALSLGRLEDERWFETKDGATFFGSGVATPLRNDGQIVGLVKVVRDLAVIHSLREQLEDAERAIADVKALGETEFETLANSITQLAWMADATGYIFWYNKRWYDYTGTDLEQMQGWGWQAVHHPDHVDRVVKHIKICFETGTVWEDTFPLRAANGEFRWFLSRARPIRNATGEIIRWFGTNTDITEIEETRRTLRWQAETLTSRIEGQTLELASSRLDLDREKTGRSEVESQLRQLQKMEAVGQLTGGIAHDFNNMLAVVLGALDLLQRRLSRGDTDVTRFVDAAMDGATRAATLTQRLLAFSRQQPLQPEALDANELVADMSELLRRSIGEDVLLETVFAGGLWTIRSDAGQLESAILNLAVNARDAMPSGGKVTVETANMHLDENYARAHDLEPGQYVMIAVTDTGTGMSPDVVERAFDPFFTTKPVGKGTGLGLSQTYGFVKQSRGHIKIYSEVGHGTCFKIYLPRSVGGVSVAHVRPVHAEKGQIAGNVSEIILVVEDEDRVRMITVDALRELGYTVVHAANGREALDQLESQPEISLLFTDIVMPGMTGRQLADHVKIQRPNLKVLFSTGYSRNAIVHNGTLDAGVHLLPKPFSLDDLARKVREVLDTM